jgi:hypothetical protein
MIVFIQIINNYMITQKYTFFKITKCLQYHGKILPALTRWMSRISFPSPSYSKKFKNFPLVGEILGLFSNRMGDGGTGRGAGVGCQRQQEPARNTTWPNHTRDPPIQQPLQPLQSQRQHLPAQANLLTANSQQPTDQCKAASSLS